MKILKNIIIQKLTIDYPYIIVYSNPKLRKDLIIMPLLDEDTRLVKYSIKNYFTI